MIEKPFGMLGLGVVRGYRIYHDDKSDPDDWLAEYSYDNCRWYAWTPNTRRLIFPTKQDAREYALMMAMKLRMMK